MCSNDPTSKQSGAVLILVLIVLTGLSVLSVEFNRDALHDHMLSVSSRSVLSSRALLDSGEVVASSLLCGPLSEEKFDDGKPAWEHFDLAAQHLSRELRSGELSGRIEDENALFPLRSLFPVRKSDKARAEACQRLFVRLTLHQLLRSGVAEDETHAGELAEAFLESLLQWSGVLAVDKVSQEWYLQQIPRRIPPGRPPLSVEELLLIRWPGLEEEKAHFVLAGTEEAPGLLSLLSPVSPGPMNMDTLRPEVIAALSMDVELGRSLAMQVEEMRLIPDRIRERNWYRELFEMHDVPAFPSGCVDKGSRWYRLTQEARIGGRENVRISIGWIGSSAVTWEYRMLGRNHTSE